MRFGYIALGTPPIQSLDIRKMPKLTDMQIRAWIKSGERFEGRADGNGLYLTRSINGRAQTNVGYNEMAEEFIPRAYGVESGQSDD